MATLTHVYVADCTVTPANGTTVTPGSYVTIRATQDAPNRPVTLLLINGVDYAERSLNSGLAYVEATVLVPAGGVTVAAICDTELPDVPSYSIQVPHVIYSGVANNMPQQPSSLIFPSGQWMFDVNLEIARIRFSLISLLRAPRQVVPGQDGQIIWARLLNFEGKGSYGLIDSGVPFYVDEYRDFGGGNVARWKRFVRLDYPWIETIVPHMIGWLYEGDVYPGGNPFLDSLCVFVQSWSKDAVCGGFEERLPSRQADPAKIPSELFGIPCGAIGYQKIPWSSQGKGTQHIIGTDFKHADTDESIYVNTPQGKKKFYHLYHVIEENSVIEPAHGTLLLEGQSVAIFTKATSNNVLTLFTVDSVDRLTDGSIDTNTGKNYYIKTNVDADVYVSSSAMYVAPDATDGTPYSFQCTCPVCGTNTWSATGLPTGLTIDSATGLISGTIPYGTAAADNTVEVTLVNNGNTVTRTFTLSNIYAVAPIPGVTWTALNKVAGQLKSIVEANDGSIIVIGDADIYRSTDGGATFVSVKGGFSNANSLRKLASGTILCAGHTLSYRSTDNGATWSDINNPGFAPVATDFVELPAGTIYMISGMGSSGATDIFKSTDDGANFSSFGTGYGDQYRIETGKVEKTADGSLIVTQSFTGATRVLKENMVGPSLDQEYLVPALSDVRSAYFAVLSDGRIMGFFDSTILIGDANGENWSVLETLPDWGGLLTPAVIGATLAETIGTNHAVYVAAKSGIATTKVFYSDDDWATRSESASVIDGDFSYKMVRLSTGTLLLGTNGATTNLWKSEP